MISGTTVVAHIGYPTLASEAPLIDDPWFEKNGVDAVVVPMGVRAGLVVGSGGVGSPLAASLAGEGVAAPGLFDAEASEPPAGLLMKQEITPFPAAAQERGCPVQVGRFGAATPEELRAVSQIG